MPAGGKARIAAAVKGLPVLAILACGGLMAAPASVAAQNVTQNLIDGGAYTVGSDEVPLYLQVYINGRDIGLLAAFTAHPGQNRMSSEAEELREIGLRVPRFTRGPVYLDTLPGVVFRYDETRQSIDFLADDSALLPNIISASQRPELMEPERSTGAVLNYSVAAEFGQGGSDLGLNAFSSTFDGWIFSPYGTLSSTGYYSYYDSATGGGEFVRQESRYEVSSMNRALTFAVGDVLSSSLSWSRPIRMGGVQLRRDFSLRSDLVTNQLMSFSGAAAVPSTVDVFIENSRAYSTQIDSGPFRLEDLPFYTGSGEAEIVIRDSTGRQRRKTVSFFASQNLMKKGMADYSIEAGVAREAYGLESNLYGRDAIVSGSFRYGVTENLTVEAHAEAKSDLTMAGLGVTTVPFALGELSFTAGLSDYNNVTAGFVQGGIRTRIAGVDINVSSMRAEKGFADLAYATGVDYLGAGALPGSAPLLEFPTALDVISLAIPVTRDNRRLGISVVHSERQSTKDLIASVSYGTSLGEGRGSVSLFGSHNFESDESRLSLNYSLALGKRTYARATAAPSVDGSATGGLYLSRPISDKVGDYGYGLQLEKQEGLTLAAARGEYRSRFGKGAAEIQGASGDLRLRGDFQGSIVLTGGRLAAGNTIQDSFAIVDVGIADVPVYLQNRPVTHTGPGGRALVPGLSSYRSNRVSVDVDDLPADSAAGVTAMEVVPARRAGTFVDFNAASAAGMSIILQGRNGATLKPGTLVRLNGGKSDFYVGYDGLTWLEGVQPENTVIAEGASGLCSASFAGQGMVIDDGSPLQTVICQ